MIALRTDLRPALSVGVPTLVLVAALAGCAPRSEPVIPRAAFVMRELHRAAVEGRDTTLARFTYPEFVGARTPAALDSLNAAVHALLTAPVAGRGRTAVSPAGLLDGFIAEWNAERESSHRHDMYWRLERRVDVLGETLGVVSLAASEFANTGGAHPVARRRLLMIGDDDGRTVRFADLFRAGARESLSAAVEPFFRAARGLARDTSLDSAGFTFPAHRFAVNENVAIAPDGVHWRFDAAEIAPHAWGPTDFVVPFGVVRRFARPGGPLDRKSAVAVRARARASGDLALRAAARPVRTSRPTTPSRRSAPRSARTACPRAAG